MSAESMQSAESDSVTVVSGVAMTAGCTTVGKSQIRKTWPESTLRKAASSLSGVPIQRNHSRDVTDLVGSVTDAAFVDGKVVFEGELDDPELATKVKRGRLDVSPSVRHDPVAELKEDDDGAKIVTGATYTALALVQTGAVAENEIKTGDSSHLSLGKMSDLEVLTS